MIILQKLFIIILEVFIPFSADAMRMRNIFSRYPTFTPIAVMSDEKLRFTPVATRSNVDLEVLTPFVVHVYKAMRWEQYDRKYSHNIIQTVTAGFQFQ